MRRKLCIKLILKEESLLPRERLVEVGPERLSNQELLAIFISNGYEKTNLSPFIQ